MYETRDRILAQGDEEYKKITLEPASVVAYTPVAILFKLKDGCFAYVETADQDKKMPRIVVAMNELMACRFGTGFQYDVRHIPQELADGVQDTLMYAENGGGVDVFAWIDEVDPEHFMQG